MNSYRVPNFVRGWEGWEFTGRREVKRDCVFSLRSLSKNLPVFLFSIHP